MVWSSANPMVASENLLVSIIIPSFNQGRFIRETLASVLSQDHRPLEILVMDGGSTDETLAVLRSYGRTPELNWRSRPDDGVVHAVNEGLQRVRGSIVGILSSDDLYLPGAITRAVEAFSEHPEAALIYGDVEYIDSDSNVVGCDILEPFDLDRYLGRFTYSPQPSAFFRSAHRASVGEWREEVSYAADADFWIRFAVRHQVKKLDYLLGQHRYHDAQRDRQRTHICRAWEAIAMSLLESGQLGARSASWVRMGVHLARYKYCPERDWMRRTWHLYRAAFANPLAVPDPCFPKRKLLPGLEPIWNVLSRIKRRLRFPARQGGSGAHRGKKSGTHV
jgi:glycosyltransferase involved in cell wall biosynthesis